MPAGSRGTQLLVLVVGLVALCAACTADAGSGTRRVAVTTGSGCPTAYPDRLPLSAVASPAVPPLRDLRVCTGDVSAGPVLLYNGGRAAWQTEAGPHVVRVVGGGGWSQWLRGHVGVSPGVVLPGESVLVWGPPDSASWRLDRDWTVAWTSLNAGIQALPASGHDSRASASRPGSPRGRSLVTCALTAMHLRRTPSLVGPPPVIGSQTPGATPTTSSPTGSSPDTPRASGPSGIPVVRALTGLDALQATWSPSTTACSADWEASDAQLGRDSGTTVRWWTAWQRAKGWLIRSARELQWLDEEGNVVLRAGR